MLRLSETEYAEVASYIALWLAIHGGDPGPVELPAEKAIEAAAHINQLLATYIAALSGTLKRASGSEVTRRLIQVGFKPEKAGPGHPAPDLTRCIVTPNGHRMCIPSGPVLE